MMVTKGESMEDFFGAEGDRIIAEFTQETGCTLAAVLHYIQQVRNFGPGPAMYKLIEFLHAKTGTDRQKIHALVIKNALSTARELDAARRLETSGRPPD